MYYSPFLDIKVGSRRSTVQTICLVNQIDIDKYGLRLCLKKIMLELENLVENGLVDQRTNKTLQIRVICNLGTVI